MVCWVNVALAVSKPPNKYKEPLDPLDPGTNAKPAFETQGGLVEDEGVHSNWDISEDTGESNVKFLAWISYWINWLENKAESFIVLIIWKKRKKKKRLNIYFYF